MARAWIWVSLALLTGIVADAQDRRGYYRYPALAGDTVVFASEGDLWTVSSAGGTARRLTTHPGQESHPAVSPDGRVLAFTARYEGPSELYTMPIDGGPPTRHTYTPDDDVTLGFTPSGDVLYASTHYATLPDPQLVTLDPSSHVHKRVPLAQASEGMFDASGETLYFVRPAFHRNVTKRYTGGTARRIWRFDSGADEARMLTSDYVGESHTPMWWSERVYFVSDRDGTMNVWSMSEDGEDARQHTRHTGWDVRDASVSEGRIIYQVAADLWLYDIASDQTRLVPIELASDFDQLREKWVTKPLEHLTSVHLHPEGESVVLTTRGRVFVAPVGSGRTAQASRQEGVRYRDVVFMPDGENLLGLTDQSGEIEFATIPVDGVGDAEALTADGAVLRFTGYPSPDGSALAYTDNNSDLWLFDVASKQQTLVSTNQEGVSGIAWAPEGDYFAYVQAASNTFNQVFLYDVEGASRVALTSDRVNSQSPAFSTDGSFLYFLSDRDLRSVVTAPWGPRAPEPYFDAPFEVYELALRTGVRSPFRPDDELQSDADPSEGEGEIELDGIGARVRRVPVESGHYRGLVANDKALFVLSRSNTRDRSWSLRAFPIANDDVKATTLVENVRSFELSRNGEKLLVRKTDALYVFDADAKAPARLGEHAIDLSGVKFSIDVREDWRQIFTDAWRLERDYFYDPGMHGADWTAILEKYGPLVDRVTTREELSELVGRVVGELSALHTSVRGGDVRTGPDDVTVASLGARLTRDEAGGGYRIDYIYRSDPDYPEEMSPLADYALGVETGDVIVSVNGVAALSVPHVGALLREQGGRQVRLRLRGGTSGTTRDVIVVPIDDERGLRYSDWEYSRRVAVEDAAQGKLGYVHLRAMGGGDVTAWYRQFYPVFDRQGLIIDVRRNRGGNIDSFILEKLMRKAWFYWKSRSGEPYWNMQYAFRGHMVVLVDENTASDGEAFADGFRRLGLGKVIGTRTWGGEIWLSSVNRLSDGGIARAPMSGVYGPEGEWLIEQHGLEPDIVVMNMPHATFEGHDAQLDAAIEYLLREIERDPRPVPDAPPFPDRSFTYPTATDGQAPPQNNGRHDP